MRTPDEDFYDVSPELKIECLRIAVNREHATAASVLADAKLFYEWVSEVPEKAEKKNIDNVVSMVKKDE